jgi:FkbM family methyltransferase
MFWLRLTKLINIMIDPFLLSALLKGAVAGVEHKAVLRNLECECVLDIGANRGQFALISRKVFPLAKIYSFEPLEEPAQIFQKIFNNEPNVILYPFAIGREKTTATIHITKDDDSSSMLPITKMQSDMFPGAAEKDTRQVMIYPLSELIDPASIPSASLLKIDVQGFELDVLQGCEDILQKFSHLYIECSFIELYEGQALAHQIIAWLEERNFGLSSIHNLYYGKNGLAVQGDFLFSKNKITDDR